MVNMIANFLILFGVFYFSMLAFGDWIQRHKKRKRRVPCSMQYVLQNTDAVLVLFAHHLREKEHPLKVVRTERYQDWLRKRDGEARSARAD